MRNNNQPISSSMLERAIQHAKRLEENNSSGQFNKARNSTVITDVDHLKRESNSNSSCDGDNLESAIDKSEPYDQKLEI